MLDVLEATIGRSGRVLDLGCGPGSLSLRILRRFPRMRVVAVDYDPVVLKIGQGALGSFGGRLTWVDAKIGSPGWTRSLPRGKFDAAVSTTALHWLTPSNLRRLYRDLYPLLRSNGVFLNGDRIPWGTENAQLHHLAGRISKLWRLRNVRGSGAWRQWWRDAARVPELKASFSEHRRRQAQHPKVLTPSVNDQIRALRRAGFPTAAVVWQIVEDRVLLAQR